MYRHTRARCCRQDRFRLRRLPVYFFFSKLRDRHVYRARNPFFKVNFAQTSHVFGPSASPNHLAERAPLTVLRIQNSREEICRKRQTSHTSELVWEKQTKREYM